MDDEASPEPNTGSDGGASIQPVPADASFHADQHRMPVPLERRLRRLAGRKGAYRGPIVANTRGWVSRDTRWHIFAANPPRSKNARNDRTDYHEGHEAHEELN